jgi:hypothetical protein
MNYNVSITDLDPGSTPKKIYSAQCLKKGNISLVGPACFTEDLDPKGKSDADPCRFKFENSGSQTQRHFE